MQQRAKNSTHKIISGGNPARGQIMTKEELEKDNTCTCCPYFFDGYCHNCTHEDCEREMLEKGDKRKMKHAPEEIKNRLSNIGEAIGNIALDYITDLEKENAELKSGCGMCYRKDKENLTKAKEIIKDLLGSENTSCEEEMFFEIRQKAEQFLNGEVEK